MALCPTCTRNWATIKEKYQFLNETDLHQPDIGGCKEGCPMLCLPDDVAEQCAELELYAQVTPWGTVQHWVQYMHHPSFRLKEASRCTG